MKTKADKAAVATISANNDPETGELLAEAFDKVGDEGVITVEENKGVETLLDHVEGMEFDKGYLSPYFATDLSKLVAEYENAQILICNKKISTVRELVPALEGAMRSGAPLLIIAEDIEGEALTALVINRLKNVLNVVAVKAPGFGERRKSYLEDIAALTGGVAITDVGISSRTSPRSTSAAPSASSSEGLDHHRQEQARRRREGARRADPRPDRQDQLGLRQGEGVPRQADRRRRRHQGRRQTRPR